MQDCFKSLELCKEYVDLQFERKQRNLICRRVRMSRKAYLANFNYFVTFTYDDAKHTEKSFKQGIKTTLRNFCYRKNWQYMGVWEKAPKTERLHFHGLFRIPDGTMPGELKERRDYNLRSRKMQITTQNSYFNERFGRCDFDEITPETGGISSAITYLIKYIEKTEERIVYSKGLYQYFYSDILESDVVTTIGQEDKKLLLFDDFRCFDNGTLIGKVSENVIQEMRKTNA